MKIDQLCWLTQDSTKIVKIKLASYAIPNSRTIVLLLGLWLVMPNAFACSCISLTLQEQFQIAAHVFVGRITRVQETNSRASHPLWRGMLGAFQVQQTFKGNPHVLQNIETGFGPSDCGLSLVEGRTYLFFADKMGSVDICSGSRAFDADDPKYSDILKELKSYAIF